MKLVVQRVKNASVKVDGKTVGAINYGYMLLVSFTQNDNEEVNAKVAEMAKLYGQTEEQLKANEMFVKYVKNSLANEKAVDFIVTNAKIK